MPDKVTEASLGIDWRPHIYRTGWFLGLCAAGIIALAFLGYRFRLGQVHQRYEAVLEERNRIAREMHDTVIQGCTSTSALLEAVASLGSGSEGETRELLDSARTQVLATVEEARKAVWNLRRGENAAPEIGPLLEQIARQASHLSHIPVTFDARGKSVPLDGDAEHVLLMVAREAVYNAVRHAQAKEVRIKVHFAAASARIEVADDGCGFDPAAVVALEGAHFGLVGMRERVESLGGRFSVDSAVAKGTRIRAEFPIRAANGKKWAAA
jgi:signal transduction histidine kinase